MNSLATATVTFTVGVLADVLLAELVVEASTGARTPGVAAGVATVSGEATLLSGRCVTSACTPVVKYQKHLRAGVSSRPDMLPFVSV